MSDDGVMSDYEVGMWENGMYDPQPETKSAEILEAERILSGNPGWYTQTQIDWAMSVLD